MPVVSLRKCAFYPHIGILTPPPYVATHRSASLNSTDADANGPLADAELQAALARLRAGELVVIPTETVYGLAADAENPQAVARIFALKGRPSDRPLIVHIAGAAALDQWATDIPDYARSLAVAFWPGPLSLVLPRVQRVPDAVTGGQDSVALRVPAHPIALQLLRAFGGGIAAPSANRYGRISPTTPAHVRAQFGDDTPLILDGGPCTGGIESTIVGCLGPTPIIMRPGLISADAIAEVTGLPVTEQASADAAVRTAGQDLSHYAPVTRTVLVRHEDPHSWPDTGSLRVGYLGFQAPEVEVEVDIRLPDSPDAAARRLYAELHRLDQAGLDVILLEAPPPTPAWRSIGDRMQRAAASRKA